MSLNNFVNISYSFNLLVAESIIQWQENGSQSSFTTLIMLTCQEVG